MVTESASGCGGNAGGRAGGAPRPDVGVWAARASAETTARSNFGAFTWTVPPSGCRSRFYLKGVEVERPDWWTGGRASVRHRDGLAQCERQQGLGRQPHLFLARDYRTCRSCACSGARADQSARRSTSHSTDRRSDARAAADDPPIAFLMAAARARHVRGADLVFASAHLERIETDT